jgi:hypothetical protein
MTAPIPALDQGATSSRAIPFDRDGRAACATQAFPSIFPGRAGSNTIPLISGTAGWPAPAKCFEAKVVLWPRAPAVSGDP